jgi:hypothetical protein
MSEEDIRAMLKLFARQLEIAAEIKSLREGNK